MFSVRKNIIMIINYRSYFDESKDFKDWEKKNQKHHTFLKM